MMELNNKGSVFRVQAVDLEGPQASSGVDVALWLVRLFSRTAILTSTWLCVWLAVDTSAPLLWASPPFPDCAQLPTDQSSVTGVGEAPTPPERQMDC